jgi:8-amino-7-oxononanoate synthase
VSWAGWVDGELEAIRSAGRWRATRPLDGLGPAVGELAGHGPVVSFASNDYLGLTAHPVVRGAARDAIDRWGSGSGASRLVVGTRPVHEALEAELADWKGTDAALLFTTGYAANLGVLATLAGPGVTVLSDELNHASIIDGCRLAGVRAAVFRHGDLDHLRSLLAAAGAGQRALVVSDSVFSMDGDVADVAELATICAETGALLVLDEAHAVLGPDLPGGLGPEVVRVGTLSKALGATGGFVAASAPIVDLLRNRARPFIFTTAPTPADTAAALAALAIVRSEEGCALAARLRRHVERIRPGHPSPIIPVVLGAEERAVAASAALLQQGLHVPAIRPPTVAPGTSRLRVALSAAHTDEQVARLVVALAALSSPSGRTGPNGPQATTPDRSIAASEAPGIDPARAAAARPAPPDRRSSDVPFQAVAGRPFGPDR